MKFNVFGCVWLMFMCCVFGVKFSSLIWDTDGQWGGGGGGWGGGGGGVVKHKPPGLQKLSFAFVTAGRGMWNSTP